MQLWSRYLPHRQLRKDSDEGKEWADYTSRRAALDEWNSTATAAVQSLAASLTAAGIDPITYLPIASSTGTGMAAA